jgi:CubicO group peptidase (beta-lactamase class C family)
MDTGGAFMDVETNRQQVLQNFVAELREGLRLPGLAAAVWQDGQLLEAAAGWRDADSLQPLTCDAHLGLGGIHQFLTAIVVLDRVAAGRLDLDAPLSRYLPELAGDQGDRILVRHLLAHTAGYRGESVADRQAMDNGSYDQFAASFDQREMLFEPGTVFDQFWSSSALLARIAERATGETFANLTREVIRTPLGIADVAPHDVPPPRRSEFWRHSLHGEPMTIGELATVGGAIASRSVFAPRVIQELLAPAVRVPATVAGRYEDRFASLGLGCGRYPNGQFGVSSVSDGCSCALRFDVESGISIAVGIRSSAAECRDRMYFRDRILEKLFRASLSEAPSPVPEPAHCGEGFTLDELAGTYEGSPHHALQATVEHGHLVVTVVSASKHVERGQNQFIFTLDERGALVPVVDVGRRAIGFFRDPISSAPCLQFGRNAFRQHRAAQPSARDWRFALLDPLKESLIVPKTVAQARLQKCFDCEHYRANIGMCRLCNCVMRFKTYLRPSHCPDRKW